MIYQDYFRNSDFEDIWTILNGFYLEHEDLKPMYASLVEAIKTLPIEKKYSDSIIQMCLDHDNEILVKVRLTLRNGSSVEKLRLISRRGKIILMKKLSTSFTV